MCTAVSSEAWAKLRDWASVAGRGRLLLSGSIAHASLETAVQFILSPSISVLSHLWGRVAVDEAGEVGLLVVPRVHAVRLQLDLGRVCQKERK